MTTPPILGEEKVQKDMASRDQSPGISGVSLEVTARHTPGPWSIEGRRGSGYIISAGVNAYGDGPEAYVGVYDPMFIIPGESEVHKANAALIIAAPDLLAALQRIADAPAWGAPERWETTPAEVRILAREAIAKAVGPQASAGSGSSSVAAGQLREEPIPTQPHPNGES